jgi:hypothetical protein
VVSGNASDSVPTTKHQNGEAGKNPQAKTPRLVAKVADEHPSAGTLVLRKATTMLIASAPLVTPENW